MINRWKIGNEGIVMNKKRKGNVKKKLIKFRCTAAMKDYIEKFALSIDESAAQVMRKAVLEYIRRHRLKQAIVPPVTSPTPSQNGN